MRAQYDALEPVTRRYPVDDWHQTTCIPCSINCGVEVKLDGPTIKRVRGDKAHPSSEGCWQRCGDGEQLALGGR